VATQVTIDRARELSAELAVEPARVLDFTQSLLACSDVALVAIASAHRQAELELAREEEGHRGDLMRGVLFGTLAPADIRGQLESYGVDSRLQYVAIRARPAGRELERALGFPVPPGRREALVRREHCPRVDPGLNAPARRTTQRSEPDSAVYSRESCSGGPWIWLRASGQQLLHARAGGLLDRDRSDDAEARVHGLAPAVVWTFES
jgi:hypothetical protein